MNRDRMRLLLTPPRNGRSMPLSSKRAKESLRNTFFSTAHRPEPAIFFKATWQFFWTGKGFFAGQSKNLIHKDAESIVKRLDSQRF